MVRTSFVVGAIVIVVAAVAVSGFMWWATRRNAFWAMAAGVLATLIIFAVAVAIAWLIASATYGS